MAEIHLVYVTVEQADRWLRQYSSPVCECGAPATLVILIRNEAGDKPDGTLGVSGTASCAKHDAELRAALAEVFGAAPTTRTVSVRAQRAARRKGRRL